MLKEVKKSLEESPIVKKGDYDYFVNPISDGIPPMKPEILEDITDAVIKYADLDVDKIVGIEAMGIHLATALSLKTGIPFVIIRKREYGLEGEVKIHKETGYGSSDLFINSLNPGEKILLIDDVVSTGGTLISTINALKQIGVEINETVVVINKGDGKEIVEKETGVKLLTLVKVNVKDGKTVVEKTIEDENVNV